MQWKTVCYLSFARFEIQRSSDGSNYNTINSFTADKLRCQQPFTFTDDQQLSEGVTYYRVNVGDLDGKIYQGKIVTVINRNKDKEMVVYPTNVTSNAALAVSLQQDENIAINMIHSSGRVVKQLRFSAIKAANYFNVDVVDIMKGTYWVSLVDTKGSRYLTSLIKQ